MSLQKRPGIISFSNSPLMATGFLLGVFLVCSGSLLVYLLKGIEWVDVNFNPGDFFWGLVIMLAVAIVEEFVFRAFILRRLARYMSKWAALAASSVLFTLAHMWNQDIAITGVANIFLGGLLFGISYMYSQELSAVILFHFSWNFFQGPVLGFPVSGLPFESLLTLELAGSEIINGGTFGFEGSIVCTALLIALFIVVWVLYQQRFERTPDTPEFPTDRQKSPAAGGS